MAEHSEPSEEPSPPPAPPGARWVPALCSSWAVLGAIAIAAAALGTGDTWPRLGLAALLTAAGATLQIAPVRLGHDGHSEYLHLDEAFLVPMAVYLSPPEVAAGLAIAAL